MLRCDRTSATEIRLAGSVDVRTVADLRAALHDAVDGAARPAGAGGPAETVLRVDVAALDLVDAAGLGVLLGAHRRAQRSGVRLVLVDVPETLSRLLFVSRLYRVLEVERPDHEAGARMPVLPRAWRRAGREPVVEQKIPA